MADELQALLKKIDEEGLKKTEAKSAELLAQARLEADALLAQARAEGAELLEGARREAESTTTRARAEAERLVEQANLTYDNTITEARQEQQRMLAESEVIRIADEEATRVRDAAHAESERRREECDAYIDDKMGRFEEFLGSTIRTVARGRDELHAGPSLARREAGGRRAVREDDHYGDGYGEY